MAIDPYLPPVTASEYAAVRRDVARAMTGASPAQERKPMTLADVLESRKSHSGISAVSPDERDAYPDDDGAVIVSESGVQLAAVMVSMMRRV